MPNLEFSKIIKVSENESGYQVTKDDGFSVWIDKKYNVIPKIGDTIILKMTQKFGQIMGIQINDNELFSKSEEEFEKEHNDWVTKTRKKYLDEYKILMEKIKNETPFETIDITGMGSGYERACQLAIRAGMIWLESHPDFKFRVKSYKNIYGVAEIETYGIKEYRELAEDLDKSMLEAVNNDMSGAMHQAIISHLKYIHENGYESWLTKFSDRKYTYPNELPKPSFGE